MRNTAAEKTTRLLDLLEAYRGWDLIDGGELWTVASWIAEWTAGAEPGDRGPAASVWEAGDGRLALVVVDEHDGPVELIGVLTREG